MNDGCIISINPRNEPRGRVGDRVNERGVVQAPGRARLRDLNSVQVVRVRPRFPELVRERCNDRLDARFDARLPERLTARATERRVTYRSQDREQQRWFDRPCLVSVMSSESHPHGEAFGPGAQSICAECAINAVGGTSSPFENENENEGDNVYHERLAEWSDTAC